MVPLTNSLQICGYNLKTLLNNLQTLSCHQKYLSKCVNFSYFLTTPFSGKIIISFKQGESETTFADILLQCISKLSKFVNKKVLMKEWYSEKIIQFTILDTFGQWCKWLQKVSKTRKQMVKPWILPNNKQMNSTSLLWYLRLTCIVSFLEEIEDTKKTFQNQLILQKSKHFTPVSISTCYRKFKNMPKNKAANSANLAALFCQD